MREFKMNVIETEGYAVIVEIEGSVKEYAESFFYAYSIMCNKQVN